METYTPPRSIEDAIEEHLYRQQTTIHEEQFDQLATNGSEAYHYIKQITIADVPMAAGQEPRDFTANLLGQFLRQASLKDVQPFALSFSVNYPTVDDEKYAANTRANIKTLQKFKRDLGHRLPFSCYDQPYDPRTTIGEIRRDLFNASLLHMRHQYRYGRIPRHANFLATDIDTSYMSNGYMSRPQAKIEEGYSYAAANKRYSTSGGEFPELDRAVSALNLQQKTDPTTSYDCHAFYSLETILAGGGFDELNTIAETHYMRRRAMKVMGKRFVTPDPVQIPGAIAISPPRRPFDKFRAGKLPYELWEEGKFGMQDAYRESVGGGQDISKDMANLIVAQCVGDIAVSVRDKLVRSILDEQGDIPSANARRAVEAHVSRILEVADLRLGLRISDLRIMDILGTSTAKL